MKTVFTSTDIKKMGIKRERLKEWMALGFVKPSIELGHGPGTKHLFSLNDMYKIKLFVYLLDLGFFRSVASEMVNSEHCGGHLGNIHFYIGKDKKATLIVDMKALMDECDRRIS